MKLGRRYFYNFIDEYIITIYQTTRKDLLGYVDEFIENLEYGHDMSDFSYQILYSTGDEVYLAQDWYEGEKIRRTHIVSIVGTNPEEDMVFGSFELSDEGRVYIASQEKISDNFIEIDPELGEALDDEYGLNSQESIEIVKERLVPQFY